MIIFGTSSTSRTGGALAQPCPHCGETEQVAIRRFRYFHLFFVPTLPVWSDKGAACNHCQLTRWGKDASDALNAEDGQSPSRPVWHYAGLAVLAALFTFITVFDHGDAHVRAADAAAAPHVGDVWVVKLEDVFDETFDYDYGVAQVTEVDEDEVFLTFSDWQYESVLDASSEGRRAAREDDAAYFTKVGVWFDRDEFVELEEVNDIFRAHAVPAEERAVL